MFGQQVAKGFKNSFRQLRYFLHKKYLPHHYEFNSPVPSSLIARTPKNIPYHKWYSNKNEYKQIPKIFYLIIFGIGFTVTDFLYTGYFNARQEYRLRYSYPEFWDRIDSIIQSQWVKKYMPVISKVWVKDQLEFNIFWEELKQVLSNQKQKNQKHDQRINQVKAQIKQIQMKYPDLIKKQESIF